MDLKKIAHKIYRNTLVFLAAAALLGACTVNPQPELASKNSGSPFARQDFSAAGKIALRYPRCTSRGCKEEAISAKFRWEHRSHVDLLLLYAPTGQEQLSLAYQGSAVTIKDSNGSRTVAREKLAQELGISIPIDGLRDWLSTPQAQPYQAQGWQIKPNGWQAGYYQTLTLTRQDYHLKILITQIK